MKSRMAAGVTHDFRGRLGLALQEAALDEDAVILGEAPVPGAPPPPEGPWVLLPYGAQFLVGGVGRGRFAPYESLWTFADAVDLAVRLATTPLPSSELSSSSDTRRVIWASSARPAQKSLRPADRAHSHGFVRPDAQNRTFFTID